jgi:hypothetical protein
LVDTILWCDPEVWRNLEIVEGQSHELPLLVDIEEALRDGDGKRVSQILLGMQRSLMVLSDVPDYAARQERLKNLENQLEALLSPKLISAFNNHSLGMPKTPVFLYPSDSFV